LQDDNRARRDSGHACTEWIVADRVDVGPDPGLPQQKRNDAAGHGKDHDRHRDAQHLALPEELETVHSGAPLHHIELEQDGLAQSGKQQSAGKRREQRGHLGIGDQPAIDGAEHE
jgi:hypothetical protein